jgi:hypothetical protein
LKNIYKTCLLFIIGFGLSGCGSIGGGAISTPNFSEVFSDEGKQTYFKMSNNDYYVEKEIVPLYRYVEKYTDNNIESMYKTFFSLGDNPLFLLNADMIIKLAAIGDNPQKGSTLRYHKLSFKTGKEIKLNVPY